MSYSNQSFKSSLTVQLFQSLSFCGLRSKMLKNIAFQPPPVSYTLRQRPKGRCSLQVLTTFSQDPRKKSQSYDEETLVEELDLYHLQDEVTKALTENIIHHNPHKPLDTELYPPYDFLLIDGNGREVFIPEQESIQLISYYLPWKKDNRVASLFIKHKHPVSEYVLLFSHGNASDLGLMIDTLIDLSNNLGINVFAYEYPGYGQSSGKPSDLNVIRCVQVAYEFLVFQLRFEPTKIIVYGYSIGSGPSVTLVSDQSYPVGGLVVHSGLTSGLRVVNKQLKKTPFYDIFPNVDRIKDVCCPVFIMHGTEDEVIEIEHAKVLSQNCQRLFELWEVENIGHAGIDTDNEHRKQYFFKLRKFLNLIMEENQKIGDLMERNKATIKIGNKHYYDTKLREFQMIQAMEEKKEKKSRQKEYQKQKQQQNDVQQQ